MIYVLVYGVLRHTGRYTGNDLCTYLYMVCVTTQGGILIMMYILVYGVLGHREVYW